MSPEPVVTPLSTSSHKRRIGKPASLVQWPFFSLVLTRELHGTASEGEREIKLRREREATGRESEEDRPDEQRNGRSAHCVCV